MVDYNSPAVMVVQRLFQAIVMEWPTPLWISRMDEWLSSDCEQWTVLER